MKKITVFLIVFTIINAHMFGQSAGDYKSVSSGNWNNANNWQVFNGANWVNTNIYPGQSSGSGTVTISNETQILITATVPYPISSLYISIDVNQLLPSGELIFSSGNNVSLMVTGSVFVYGSLLISDQAGTRSHSLFIGGSLEAGTWVYIPDPDCTDIFYCSGYYSPLGGNFQTVNNDDKLHLTFNTTTPNSTISGSAGIAAEDIDFNGIGISVYTSVYISGVANFVNGIVKSGNFCGGGIAMDASGSSYYSSNCAGIYFYQQATASGSSSASFVDGRVWKDVNSSFTFPIGSGGIYSPLTVSIPAGIVKPLSARYVRSGVEQISWGITDPGLYSLSSCEFWELNSGSSFYDDYNPIDSIDYPVDITVGWNNSSGCNSSTYVTNVSDVTLAHLNYTDKSWNTHGGVASGKIENGSVTNSGVRNLGFFTLGNINTDCVTPSQLVTTNVSSNSATLNWSSVPGAVSYDVDYMPSYNHWINLASGITTTTFNLSGLNYLTSYYWRVRTKCGSSLSAYRLTQFTTKNPCEAPSGLTTTNITSTSATLNWNAVPNAGSYTVGYKESNATSWIYVYDISTLSYELNGLSSGISYDWKVYALCRPDSYTILGGNIAQSSFTTSIFCNDTYETNNTSSQAKAINLGAVIKAGISSSTDVDWFKIVASNNSRLEITLSNLPADYDLYVYNKNLTLAGSSINSSTSNEVVIFDSHARNATFYIKVVGKNGAYNSAQCYDLLAEAIGVSGAITVASTADIKSQSSLNTPLIYPGPASQVIYLNFESEVEDYCHVTILNTIGQTLKQYSLNVVKGHNQFKLPVMNLASGTYILKMDDSRFSIVKKFMIAR